MLEALLVQAGEQHQRHGSKARAGRPQTQPPPAPQGFSAAEEFPALHAGRQRFPQAPGMMDTGLETLSVQAHALLRGGCSLAHNSEKKK